MEQQKRLAEEAKAKELAQKETNTPAKAPKSEETPNSKAGKQAKHGASGSKNKQKDNHAHSSSHGNVWQSPANKNNGGAFSGNNAGYGNSPFSAGYGYPPVPPGQEVYYPTMPMNQGMGYGSSNSAYSYDQSGNKGYGYNGYDESTNNAEDIYINGALELSAVAKPFVPKTFTPATLPTPATSSSTPTMDQSTSMPPLAPSNLSSGFPTSILPHMDLPSALSNNTSSSFLKGLGSSTNSLTGLEGNNMLGVGSNLWSTSGVGLSGGAGGSSLGKLTTSAFYLMLFMLTVCFCFYFYNFI